MTVFLLVACTFDSNIDCETEEREVGDDEVVGDFGATVSELFAPLAGTREVEGTYGDGTTGAVAFDVARGEGAALLVDSTAVQKGHMRLGFGVDYDLQPVCDDRLTVPVDVALWTEDEHIDVDTSDDLDISSQGWAAVHAALGDAETAESGDPEIYAAWSDDTLSELRVRTEAGAYWERAESR
jgi:hypothetical protein